MLIIGYTYDAAVHCVDCTQYRFGVGPYPDVTDMVDSNGIPFDATDSEGNGVEAVMDIDEGNENERCDDCLEPLE